MVEDRDIPNFTLTFIILPCAEAQNNQYHDVTTESSALTDENADELIGIYNTNIKYIVDKHRAEQVEVTTLRPHHMRHDDQIKEAERKKRRCERKYEKSNLEKNRQNQSVKCKSIL